MDGALGLHFDDDFQFDRRAEWKARDANDKARRDGLIAEDIAEQLRRRVGDLRVLGELSAVGGFGIDRLVANSWRKKNIRDSVYLLEADPMVWVTF